MFFDGEFNSGYNGVHNALYVSGKLPSTVTDATRLFHKSSSLRIPYDFLKNASSLITLYGTFNDTSVTFYKPSGSTIDLPRAVISGQT